jgi:hypothetical protein
MGLIDTIKAASQRISKSTFGVFVRELPLLITLRIFVIITATIAIAMVLNQMPKMEHKPFNPDAYYCTAYGSTAFLVGIVAFVAYPFITSVPLPIIILVALAASVASIVASVAFDNILRINDLPEMRENERTPEGFLSRIKFLHTVNGFLVGSVFVFFHLLCPFKPKEKQK